MDKTIRQLFKDELNSLNIPTEITQTHKGYRGWVKEYIVQDGVRLDRKCYKTYTASHNRKYPADARKQNEELIVYCNGYVDKEVAKEIADRLMSTYHRAFTETSIIVF